ncbi:hypothetical protein IBE20_04560 [Francisella tularensis subsp. novicida]|uniref:Uncharacterized protein n=1 Tax=Francisella tularensis TaxID=263 RepID=A0A6I4RYE0_FRATU|nr:hypothetical protein [Francisella tularensis]AJI61485.1 hypothetical protein AW25_1667 [Francisella tularensis subsp. novicida U112]EDX19140.1 hypothetical protein FTE_1430 [Francisella tularensis subsp. novicida FTE]MBK2035067.1 hypothetical protein [Francisella tularensis subsp. novicida]MBK2116341.1 hypothetical protein [Francisella tularensis subsp. novicida]MBK2312181.1 hypothetical protein [Francisella tularensis subsp. novicida]
MLFSLVVIDVSSMFLVVAVSLLELEKKIKNSTKDIIKNQKASLTSLEILNPPIVTSTNSKNTMTKNTIIKAIYSIIIMIL